ncbi:hypothetical protein JOF35_005596 [Streptomyces demainii]|uniref:Uncharacterized protein n=1 Tax=Streptomyces demainii TaxID=588122 RepID=A0ABT9KXT3_9ACTN|nr:hypothetical protein [Streptomyces demainii]
MAPGPPGSPPAPPDQLTRAVARGRATERRERWQWVRPLCVTSAVVAGNAAPVGAGPRSQTACSRALVSADDISVA